MEPETLPGSLPGDQGDGDTVKMLPAEEILPGSPAQSEEEPVMAVASVVREIEAEIAREEERRSREEMILPQASEPETMPVEPAAPPVTEEDVYKRQVIAMEQEAVVSVHPAFPGQAADILGTDR